VSISAVTSDALRANGISNAQDISKTIAGVSLDSVSSGSSNAQLVVRGVSQSDFSSFQESPNSIYVDDIYLSSPAAAGFTLYDLDRVEILRGPQGTLFGRSSSGGLANFVPKHPSKDWDGYAEIGFGSFGDAYAEAAIGGPLTDRIRFRVAGRREVSNGWWHNDLPNGHDTFETNFAGIRGQIEADVTDNFTARLSIGYDKNPEHRDGMYRSVPYYVVNGQPTPLPADVDAYGTGPGNSMAGYRNTDKQVQSAAFNNVGFFKNERFAPTLFLTWQAGNATITSISNYTRFKFKYNEDCDGGPVDFCQNNFSQNLKQFSQEFRINGTAGSLIYTAGGYYLNTDQTVDSGFYYPSLTGTDFAFNDFNNVRQKLSSISVFGQVEYKFTPKLKLTIGGRFSHDIKRFESRAYYNELGNAYIDGSAGSTVFSPPLLVYDFTRENLGNLARIKDDLWSGKVQLDYKPIESVLLYAGVSRGSKGGGFNADTYAGLACENPADASCAAYARTPFRSEFLYDYEVGAKLQMFDRRLTLNLSAFNYDYHHFQGFAFVGLQSIVSNYNGYFRGGELELNVKPVPSLNVMLGVSYLRSKLHDVQTTYDGVRDVEGVNSPRWTVKGSISKDFQIGNDKLTLLWSGDYVDDRYASVDNNPATFIKGSFVHNARINYHVGSMGVDLSAFVNNISDVARQTFAFDSISSEGMVLRGYSKPRWFGGSIRKQF